MDETKKTNPAKLLYQELRRKNWTELWAEDVAEFDAAPVEWRVRLAPVVRAVGVVALESGDPEIREQAAEWLLGLLNDPVEKVRRYAIAALPKLGLGREAEVALHEALSRSASESEKALALRTLEKVGGSMTLELGSKGGVVLPLRSLQKVEANAAREENPGEILLDKTMERTEGVSIRLNCRRGMEEFAADEVRELGGGQFKIMDITPGAALLNPTGPFNLGDILKFRCFSSIGFPIGRIEDVADEEDEIESVACIITGGLTTRILQTFTEGPVRFRVEYLSDGHRRGAVRKLAARVFELSPWMLNDSRDARWQINIAEGRQGMELELVPRFRPDPRFNYRNQDVPAASHPPLAACLARVADLTDGERIWDPFCGSALELIESGRLAPGSALFGSDHDLQAIRAAKANMNAAGNPYQSLQLFSGDFRDAPKDLGIAAGTLTLIITNPPMGRRVPIEDLGRLISDLFSVSSRLLGRNGRLLLMNPLPGAVRQAGLKLDFRRKIDLGGFACHLERYQKT